MSDEGTVRGLIAVVSLVTFLGICWWAYRPGSRARFEQDALLVFDDADGVPASRPVGGRETSGSAGEREERGESA